MPPKKKLTQCEPVFLLTVHRTRFIPVLTHNPSVRTTTCGPLLTPLRSEHPRLQRSPQKGPHCRFPFLRNSLQTLSDHGLCPTPAACWHAHISLIGYARYQIDSTHEFIPIPSRPTPVHNFVCEGCAETREDCIEGCRSFLEELTRYTVHHWDLRDRAFKEIAINKNEYNPLYHGYFSYRLWKAETREIEKKQREKRK